MASRGKNQAELILFYECLSVVTVTRQYNGIQEIDK